MILWWNSSCCHSLCVSTATIRIYSRGGSCTLYCVSFWKNTNGPKSNFINVHVGSYCACSLDMSLKEYYVSERILCVRKQEEGNGSKHPAKLFRLKCPW